jgi:hypothetical protein
MTDKYNNVYHSDKNVSRLTHITLPTVFNSITRDGVRRETVYRETV